MLKKYIFLLFVFLGCKIAMAQVGIGTINPLGVLHIDGAKDNAATGMPTVQQQRNDFIITATAKVGIGTVVPANSASLEINSTTTGFLPPRMTSTQMLNIQNAIEGLMIYCLDCTPKGIRLYDGLIWKDSYGVVNSNNPNIGAIFSFTGNYLQDGDYYATKIMTSENTVSIEVNVLQPGFITFISNDINGYVFNSNLEFQNIGITNVILKAKGKQTNFNQNGDDLTIIGIGKSFGLQNIKIINVGMGNQYTLSNGLEPFNNNLNCYNSIISTGHTSATCTGTFTVAPDTYTYGQTLINGQCWMSNNLRISPSAPCSSSPNTGCNTWTNTSSSNIGAWGAYNFSPTNGSAGWGGSISGDAGLMYQWSAAMKGSTVERSRGVCPVGWHIPSDCEWQYLEHGLGMSISNQNLKNNSSRNNNNESGKLRAFGTGATNSVGFWGWSAGRRNYINGSFSMFTSELNIWTSSANESSTNALRRRLTTSGIMNGATNRADALSVRCLKN
jgi:uncharacterized protein (TIGR02145 family)